MIPHRSGTTAQVWRAHVEICPITSGLETKMTRPTFKKMCQDRLMAAKAKEVQNSGDPHAKFCRKCKGQIVPAELTFIEVAGAIQDSTPYRYYDRHPPLSETEKSMIRGVRGLP